MKICSKCNSVFDDDVNFCHKCGTPLKSAAESASAAAAARYCTNCGNKCEGDEKFCIKCGTRLEIGAAENTVRNEDHSDRHTNNYGMEYSQPEKDQNIGNTFYEYRVDIIGGNVKIPNVCPVCCRKADSEFKVKGQGLAKSSGVRPDIVEILTKMPICSDCNNKRKKYKLLFILYHIVFAVAMAHLFPVVAHNQEEPLFIIVFLLIPVAAAALWNVFISSSLIKSGKAISGFVYENLNDMPHVVKAEPFGNTTAFRFGNKMFAEMFALANGAAVLSKTKKTNKHFAAQILLSVSMILCLGIIALIVYAMFA